MEFIALEFDYWWSNEIIKININEGFRMRWINEEEIVEKKSYLYLNALKQASERDETREREIYSSHDPYVRTSIKEHMGLYSVYRNKRIFSFNSFIIISIIIFK